MILISFLVTQIGGKLRVDRGDNNDCASFAVLLCLIYTAAAVVPCSGQLPRAAAKALPRVGCPRASTQSIGITSPSKGFF